MRVELSRLRFSCPAVFKRVRLSKDFSKVAKKALDTKDFYDYNLLCLEDVWEAFEVPPHVVSAY
jgi:hypothetical protein